MQTEWDTRKISALAASKESKKQSSKLVTDHASGTAENPILIDGSSEGFLSTGSPGKDMETQPQPNILTSERTVESSHSSGMKEESQTFVSSQ